MYIPEYLSLIRGPETIERRLLVGMKKNNIEFGIKNRPNYLWAEISRDSHWFNSI